MIALSGKKVRLLLLLGVGVIVIAAVFVAGWYFFSTPESESTSGEQTSTSIFGRLPFSGNRESPLPTPTPSPIVQTAEERLERGLEEELSLDRIQPGSEEAKAWIEQAEQDSSAANKVAVDITYSFDPRFSINIQRIEKTSLATTTSFHEPFPGELYSIARLKNEVGGVISEQRFSVSPEIIVEDPDRGTVFPARDVTASFVFDLSGQVPTSVEFITSEGEVLATQSFDYSELPQLGAVSEKNAIARFLKKWNFVEPALAQQASGANERPMTIVVINELGASPRQVTAQAQAMVDSIAPWTQFKDLVEVKQVDNFTELGCKTVLFGGFTYPDCSSLNWQQVRRVLEEKNVTSWDALVIVSPARCNCGTAGIGTGVTTVGTRVNAAVLAHELGHAIGSMVDEYMYQYNYESGYLGPNCFPTQNACQAAIRPYESQAAAECSLGCRTVSSWRPATRLMHNSYQIIEFGPVEFCLMGTALSRKTGRPNEGCATGSGEDTYWGWYRGGLYGD